MRVRTARTGRLAASALACCALLAAAAACGPGGAHNDSASNEPSASASSGGLPGCVPVRKTAPPDGLPDIALHCLHGGTVALGTIRGPAVVNLWASWCGPCRSEMPALAESADAHGRVTFLGVDTEDERAAAVRFLRLTGVRYPQLLDPSGRVLRALGLPGLPATFALDAGGHVVWRSQGGVDAAGLRSAVAAAQRRATRDRSR